MDDTVQVPVSKASRLAPMFVAADEPQVQLADTPFDLPGDPPVPDDIPEVPVPASVRAVIASEAVPPPHEQDGMVDATMRLLEGKITAWVASQSTATMQTVDRVYEHVASCLDKIAVANDHAQYQLANALDRLSAGGVQLTGTPYTATIETLTPQGFPLTLTLQKRSAEELVSALEGLTQWLQSQGYNVPADARVPF